MLVENADDQTAADPSLLRIIARAHHIQARLIQNTKLTVHDIALEERVSAAYIYSLLRLPWLANGGEHRALGSIPLGHGAQISHPMTEHLATPSRLGCTPWRSGPADFVPLALAERTYRTLESGASARIM
jgi:hypothetical protein